MIDCSPSSTAATHKIRVIHVTKSRESVSRKNEVLQTRVQQFEQEVDALRQSVKEREASLIEKRELEQKLEKKMKKLNESHSVLKFEAQHLIESMSRYRTIPVAVLNKIDPKELLGEITNTRTQIINMEKEMLEIKKINNLKNKISAAQSIRTKLLKRDAQLVEILNSLTLKLKVLKYAGNSKLVLDSDIIIEKQLVSEEIRNQLENEMKIKKKKRKIRRKKKRISPMMGTNDAVNQKRESKKISKRNNYLDINTESSTLYSNDAEAIGQAAKPRIHEKRFDIEYEKTQEIIQAAKDKLNEYLRRERKIDNLEHDKRRKLTILYQYEQASLKRQKIHETWAKKKGDVEITQILMQKQINSLSSRLSADIPSIQNDLRANKLSYDKIREENIELGEQYKELCRESILTTKILYRSKIEGLKNEVEGLEVVLKNLENRVQTYRRLNTDNGFRDFQEISRSIHILEDEIAVLVKKNKRIRKSRKFVQANVQSSKLALLDLGVKFPAYYSTRGDSEVIAS